MKVINKKVLFFAILFSVSSLTTNATDWRIIGDAVEQGTQAVLVQSSGNSQEFVYVGKLSNQQFKITDGVKTYIHDCGDNDPLGDSILLREETDSNDKGLRIRYVGQQDYFKITLNVTRNTKSIEAERIIPPKNVYVMGGPFNNDVKSWKLQDAIELEHDKDNPFVFYYKGNIRYNELGDEKGSIKFLKGKSWGENYHPYVSGDVPLAQAIKTPMKIRLGGEDNKWTIPADRSGDGYYKIKIDLLNLTITVEEFIHNIDNNPFPLAVYIVGDAMPCGWNNEHPMAMKKVEEGIYQWKGKVTKGQFKFLQRRGTWERCYVATSVDKQVFSDEEYDIVYEESYFVQGNDYKFVVPEAGESNFTVNLNTMKLSLTDQPVSYVGEIQADNGITFYSSKGKLFLKSEHSQPLQAHIFSVEGRAVAKKSFIGSTDFLLAKGFYIVVLTNDKGEKIMNIRTFIY